MPGFKRNFVLAGAGDQVSVLQGWQYETPNFPAALQIAIMADPGDVIRALISSGSDLLLSNGQLDEKALTLPLTTDDVQFTDTVLPGEKIVIEATGTAAADGFRVLVNLVPL